MPGRENITMRLSRGKLLLLLFAVFLLPGGCRTAHTELSGTPLLLETFDRDYDEVWEELEVVLAEDLMIPVHLKDKKKGIIETDWISVIRMRGTLRWNLKILVAEVNNQTTVRIYERVEEPMNPKDTVGKMKTKQGEVKTGWQTSEEKIPETDTIFKSLKERLGQ